MPRDLPSFPHPRRRGTGYKQVAFLCFFLALFIGGFYVLDELFPQPTRGHVIYTDD